ncbi:class I SAM-dependent methyltransferase [Paenibacillus piri]|uniref:Methyltransferase domain-containing protein n=1 Tax=Paenibacillus piri TaxID=2547395 RepID=A0A4R5KL73_9BACL|nr:class I SAM-dependent methyltransferase [Paenibacillus piri]TDF96319.1 methyltransferase domain-containing protein [Paenibacillus piri]
MGFLSILSYAHKLIEERIAPGEAVVDATAGNGVDTLFLAKLVGPEGSVDAFDIQQQALDKTGQRIRKEQPDYSHVRLHLRSHDQLEAVLPEALHGRLGAVMFNLGYLPGNDHDTVTTPASTIPALQKSAKLLRKGGILTVVLYTGHEGGEQEALAVRQWAEQLPQQQFQVLEYRFMNQQNHPPYLIAVEKRSAD